MEPIKLKVTPDQSDIILPLIKLSPADFYANDEGAQEFIDRLIAHFGIDTYDQMIHLKHGFDVMERFSHQPKFTKILHIVSNEPSGKYRKWAAEGPPSHVDDETLLRLIFTMTVINSMNTAKEKAARVLIRHAAMQTGVTEAQVSEARTAPTAKAG